MVLLELFEPLAGGTKIKTRGSAQIDNFVFKLHYKATTLILVGCCLLVTMTQLIGSPINCDVDDGLSQAVIDSYCWIHSTFSVNTHHSAQIGADVAYHGVGPLGKSEEPTYHAYYQWVPFVLLLQGFMFYFPHYLWKLHEAGRMERLISMYQDPVISDADYETKKEQLVIYTWRTFRHHKIDAMVFYFTEFLNFVIVIGNIWFTNLFFGGAFATYGTDVLNFVNDNP